MRRSQPHPMDISSPEEMQSKVACVPLIRAQPVSTGKPKAREEKLCVQEAGENLLRTIQEPCTLVSIGGSMRKGKSSLMNFLANAELFRVDNRGSCTRGVDISTSISGHCFLDSASSMSGRRVRAAPQLPNVLFADLEGTGEQGSKYDASLMLAMLTTSSVFLYNIQGQHGNADILEKLSQLADLGQKITGAEAGKALFGHLHLVFRDWQFGELSEQDIQDYIIKKEKFDSVESEEDDDASVLLIRKIQKNNRWREQIKRAFQSVTVTLMPFPTIATTTLQKKQLTVDDLQPAFIEKLHKLKGVIASQLRDVETQPNGSRLAGLCQLLVEQINSNGGVISMVDIGEQLALQEAKAQVDHCLHETQDHFGKQDAVKDSVIRAELDRRFAACASKLREQFGHHSNKATILSEAAAAFKNITDVLCAKNNEKCRLRVEGVEEKVSKEMLKSVSAEFEGDVAVASDSLQTKRTAALTKWRKAMLEKLEVFCDDRRAIDSCLKRLETTIGKLFEDFKISNEKKVERVVDKCVDRLLEGLKRDISAIPSSQTEAKAMERLNELWSAVSDSVNRELGGFSHSSKAARQQLELKFEILKTETLARISKHAGLQQHEELVRQVQEIKTARQQQTPAPPSPSPYSFYDAPSTPVRSYYTAPSTPDTDVKFYKGGQFTPGGGRAPAGGIYMSAASVASPRTPSYSGGKFYKGGQFLPGGGRAPAGGVYM